MITESDIEAVERVLNMHAVYRMYAASGRLLYVGMTGGLDRRLVSHEEKRWFPQVASITLEWHPTRDAAAEAERQAIATEHPRINIAGRSAKVPPIAVKVPTGMPDGPVSLAEAVGLRILRCSLGAARKAARRPGFPAPVGKRDMANLYEVDALCAYDHEKAKVRR